MPSKKPAVTRKAVKGKPVASKVVPSSNVDPAAGVRKRPLGKTPWGLPIAAVTLVVASGALWLAVRESSSATQAATPAPTHAAMAPAVSEGSKAEPAASDAPKPAEAVRPAETAKAVSISGCLQRGDSGFVLKDVDGAAAPKARSWKSGFIRKANAAVDLREGGSAARLASHVGQRVSVSGPLVNREMQVQSLRRLSSSCE